MGEDVYLLYTPLHLLYTISLIRANKRPSHVMLIYAFPAAPQALAQLRNLLPDTRFTLLPGHFSPWGRRATAAMRRRNPLLRPVGKLLNHVPIIQAMWQARRELSSIELGRLFLSNDMRPEAQALIATALRRRAEIWLVEDGLAIYVNTPQRSWLRERMVWLQRIVYGHRFMALSLLGSHPDIQQAIVLYPQAVGKALMRVPRHPMPRFALQEDVKFLIQAFAPEDTPDWEAFGRCVLICLPLFDYTAEPETFQRAVSQIIASCHAEGITVLVKYHPREDVFHFSTPGVYVVNQNIPAELICAALGKQLVRLYSEVSSILLTAGWVNPDIHRTMLNEGRGEESLVTLLKQQGVDVLDAETYH